LKFAQLESDEERIKVGKEIYDMYIMRELLSLSHVSTIDVISNNNNNNRPAEINN